MLDHISRHLRINVLIVLTLCICTLAGHAQPRVGPTTPDEWMKRFLDVASQTPHRGARRALKRVLDDPQTYRFQLLITEYLPSQSAGIDPVFKMHDYRVDREYIYPASAVKVFGSLGALRYFTLLRDEAPWLTTNDALGMRRSCKMKDSSNVQSGWTTLEHEIKKTHLVSSNRAFNRLFNVTGFRRLHEYILPHFPSVRVFHRLSSSETHAECLETPPLYLCDITSGGDGLKISSKRTFKREAFTSRGDISDLEAKIDPSHPTGFGARADTLSAGVAYISMKTKKRVSKPMDFTYKNRVSFYDFQRLLMGIFRPRLATPLGPPVGLLQPVEENPEGIRKVWLRELRHAMAIYPRHSLNPTYPNNVRSETRFKPLIGGVRLADKRLTQDHDLYYLNKAGKALGFHLDNAFIGYGPKAGVVNAKTGFGDGRVKRGLFITVGLYVNKDQVLNDNKYEYKRTSVPLFKAIGYAVGRYLMGDLR